MNIIETVKIISRALFVGDFMNRDQYTALKDIYNTYFFGGSLRTMIKPGDKVLELGCGKESLLVRSGLIRGLNVTGVDIFKPYVDAHSSDGLYKTCILSDITEIDFEKDSFDAVICMDVLEHITKDKILSSGLLIKMQEWGRKVIITTPNGFITNTISDGNEYQNHQSGWTADELRGYGFTVRGVSGWKPLRKPDSQLRHIHPLLFWAGLSLISSPLVYYAPEHAFHLLAIYERSK